MPRRIQQYINNETGEVVFTLYESGQIILPNGLSINQGNGSPEGVVVAVVGSIYQCLDGVGGFSFYTKLTGDDENGWVGLGESVPGLTLYNDSGIPLAKQLMMAGIGTLDTGSASITIPPSIYDSNYVWGAVATSFSADPISVVVGGNTAIFTGVGTDSFYYLIFTARFSPI
jgi:hypothetical protein